MTKIETKPCKKFLRGIGREGDLNVTPWPEETK